MTKVTRRGFLGAAAAAPLAAKSAVRGISTPEDFDGHVGYRTAAFPPMNPWQAFSKFGLPDWKREEMFRNELRRRETNAGSLKSVSPVIRARMEAREEVERQIRVNFLDEDNCQLTRAFIKKFWKG